MSRFSFATASINNGGTIVPLAITVRKANYIRMQVS